MFFFFLSSLMMDSFWTTHAPVLSPSVDRDIEFRSKQLFDTQTVAQVKEWEKKSQQEIARKAEELRSLIGFFFFFFFSSSS